jgi:Cys-tRNA(Pro)/Cys-tRNA(Cys) deacylase
MGCEADDIAPGIDTTHSRLIGLALDFKALAHQTGGRKVDTLPLKEVQAAAGYIRGGVTALVCKKDYAVYIDELAEICDVISVSAGTI